MSAIAPAEARPVARNCPICGKELPAGGEQCSSCAAETVAKPATRLCPVCASELPLRAQKCLKCGEYVNWKGRLTSVKATITYGVTTTAAVIGIIIAWPRVVPAPGPAPHPTTTTIPGRLGLDVANFAADAEAKFLSVRVTNNGTEESRPSWNLKLNTDEPNVIEFGALEPRSPAKIIAPGATETLDFNIRNIRPMSDVNHADFWARHGTRTITLTGTVVDSSGKSHDVTPRSVPLNALKNLVIRLVPVHALTTS
jgi:predicted nucleic acid-binding Zn ribbon protein